MRTFLRMHARTTAGAYGLIRMAETQKPTNADVPTSVDPLAPLMADQFVAAFIYANNRPTVLVDPFGLRPEAIADECGYIDLAGWGDWSREKTHELRDRLPWKEILLVGGSVATCARGGLSAARAAAVSFNPYIIAGTGAVGCGLAVGARNGLGDYFDDIPEPSFPS
jgi:hypothetical protein